MLDTSSSDTARAACRRSPIPTARAGRCAVRPGRRSAGSATVPSGFPPPGALGPHGGGHRLVDIVGRPRRDLEDDLLGARVDDVDDLVGAARPESPGSKRPSAPVLPCRPVVPAKRVPSRRDIGPAQDAIISMPQWPWDRRDQPNPVMFDYVESTFQMRGPSIGWEGLSQQGWSGPSDRTVASPRPLDDPPCGGDDLWAPAAATAHGTPRGIRSTRGAPCARPRRQEAETSRVAATRSAIRVAAAGSSGAIGARGGPTGRPSAPSTALTAGTNGCCMTASTTG